MVIAGAELDGGPGPRARDADDDRLLALDPGIDHAQHPHDAGDREQLFGEGIFGGRIALGGDDHEAALAGPLQRRQGLRAPDREWHRNPWENHDISHRQHRQDGGDLDPLVSEISRLCCRLPDPCRTRSPHER